MISTANILSDFFYLITPNGASYNNYLIRVPQ